MIDVKKKKPTPLFLVNSNHRIDVSCNYSCIFNMLKMKNDGGYEAH